MLQFTCLGSRIRRLLAELCQCGFLLGNGSFQPLFFAGQLLYLAVVILFYAIQPILFVFIVLGNPHISGAGRLKQCRLCIGYFILSRLQLFIQIFGRKGSDRIAFFDLTAHLYQQFLYLCTGFQAVCIGGGADLAAGFHTHRNGIPGDRILPFPYYLFVRFAGNKQRNTDCGCRT